MFSSVRLFGLLAICLCASLQFSEGQVVLDGPCPNIPVVPNFDISAYMGLWYEVAKYPAPFEDGGKCITANYEPLENGTVSVVNTQYNTIAEREIQIEGNAEVVENAKLLVQFPGQAKITSAPTGSNYWVIGTDYVHYSVIFSCHEISQNSHSELIWILTRERVPSMDTQINALIVLTSNQLSLNYLTITDQKGCE